MTSNVSDIFRPAQTSTLQIGNAWPGNSRVYNVFIHPGAHRNPPGWPPYAPVAPLFICAGLKGEAFASRVILGRRRVAEQPAEVDEMFLGRAALFQGDAAPFVDELLGSDGHGADSDSMGWMGGWIDGGRRTADRWLCRVCAAYRSSTFRKKSNF